MPNSQESHPRLQKSITGSPKSYNLPSYIMNSISRRLHSAFGLGRNNCRKISPLYFFLRFKKPKTPVRDHIGRPPALRWSAFLGIARGGEQRTSRSAALKIPLQVAKLALVSIFNVTQPTVNGIGSSPTLSTSYQNSKIYCVRYLFGLQLTLSSQ